MIHRYFLFEKKSAIHYNFNWIHWAGVLRASASEETMLEVKQLSKSFWGKLCAEECQSFHRGRRDLRPDWSKRFRKEHADEHLERKWKIRRTGGYEGEILIDGKEIRIENRAQSEAQGIAMVHQELALFAGMTVGENIKINRENVKAEAFLCRSWLM